MYKGATPVAGLQQITDNKRNISRYVGSKFNFKRRQMLSWVFMSSKRKGYEKKEGCKIPIKLWPFTVSNPLRLSLPTL
jgi:hypothetical protein